MSNSRPRLAIFFLGCLAVFGCSDAPTGGDGKDHGESPSFELEARPQNVLLITIDTLRADRLGAYGHTRDTSPNLDALAARGALFQSAFTHVPLTLPSHSSMLTGQLPVTHGARTNWTSLGEGTPTLAEILAEKGFQTAAVVGGFVLNSRFGISRGFDYYDDRFQKSYRNAREVDEGLRRWFAQRDPQKPFFLWAHYMDCHAPYNPPKSMVESLGLTITPERAQALESVRRRAILDNDPPSSEDIQAILELYDAEIRYVDTLVGNLLAILTQNNLLDDTLIVITSDHGEGFAHEYWFDHGDRLYDEQLHVPMILVHPGSVPAGVRVPDLVRTTDIFPTVLDTFGFDVPDNIAGRTMRPYLEGLEDIDRVVFSETYLRKAKGYQKHVTLNEDERSSGTLYAMRSIDRKLIKTIYAQEGMDPRFELYDVANDPQETQDRAAEDPELLSKMTKFLETYTEKAGLISGSMDPTLSAEDIQKLNDLGYFGDG